MKHLFFFGTWLTVIFRRSSFLTPRRGLNIFTCKPTLIFLVSAPCGNTACTCGTTVLDTIPPSGPIACTSCRMRDTTAKYCGKSYVTKRQILPPDDSSNWFMSVEWVDIFFVRNWFFPCLLQDQLTSGFEVFVQCIMNNFVAIFDLMLTPCFAVVRTKYNNFTLFAAQWCEMWNFHDYWSNEFRSDWAQFENSTGQCFSLHQLWWMQCSLRFHVTAGDASWLGSRSWWHNYANATMTTAPHRTAARINQKWHQKAKREFATSLNLFRHFFDLTINKEEEA